LRCLIAAGGTAGHVLPALAVAEALTARGAEVTFAGSPDRIESRLVPAAGYELDTFRVSGLPRTASLKTLKAALIASGAPLAASRILRRRRPDVVLGAGGYVAGPMVLAAGVHRIPAGLTEADAHLGLANRLAAPFAARVFLAYPLPGRTGRKYRVVGRPIPERSRVAAGRVAARRRFELPADGPALLVCGGSLGARALNLAAVAAYGEEGPAVLHLTGERDFPELREMVARPSYRLLPFTDDFGGALAAADLVVSRAGGAVWEIAAAGKPALLVPYPDATSDHQTANARWFERGGGALLVPEGSLALRSQVDDLLGDAGRLASMSRAMLRLARPEAATDVAEELIALAAARR